MVFFCFVSFHPIAPIGRDLFQLYISGEMPTRKDGGDLFLFFGNQLKMLLAWFSPALRFFRR
ncbi:hypothetical protein DBR40_20370 [Pedobacter sp. KBW01]|nr:hypothetical protein DBR40_20370 [Pedobacter sp. KBW01]